MTGPSNSTLPTPPSDPSEMRHRVRSFGWEKTPLGPVERWPQALQVAVGICLNSRFPMFVWWGPQLINIYNDAYVSVLGKRHPAALGRPAREIWGEIWNVIGPQADAVMQRGEATWNERVHLIMERNNYTEDTFFTWSYSPIFDHEGKIGGLFCACTEETQRVKAEADRDRLVGELDEQRRLLSDVFERSPSFMAVLHGPDHVYELVNKRYYEVVGQRELVGRTVTEALPELAGQGFIELLDRVYASGDVYIGRERAVMLQRQKGGALEERHIEYVYQPLRDPAGAVSGIFVHGIDLTERRDAEQRRDELLEAERAARAAAERASEAKSEFLATLSHELRTPLTPVMLTVSLMESHPGLPSDLRDDVATIRRNVELESRLISDLLDLTRITNGKMQLDLQTVDLNQIVLAALNICQRESPARVELDLAAEHHFVRGDSTRLQQIFWNLINNAFKFTPADRLISIRSSNPTPGLLRVDVVDHGEGIDAAILPRLFNAFEQGEVRTRRQQAGLGLGLAISRKLAEAHGGTIFATSEGRGRGAVFTVEFPTVSEFSSTAPGERPSRPPTLDQSLRVLLVEDHEPTLKVMTRLLRGLGYQVTEATSVASAIGVTQREEFDLIISDLGLPDGSGLDVMRQLADQYAGRSIALTGYGMESDIAASKSAGFAQHLTKPIDLDHLQRAIAELSVNLPKR